MEKLQLFRGDTVLIKVFFLCRLIVFLFKSFIFLILILWFYLLHDETSIFGRGECCCLRFRKCPPFKIQKYSSTKVLYIYWSAFESMFECVFGGNWDLLFFKLCRARNERTPSVLFLQMRLVMSQRFGWTRSFEQTCGCVLGMLFRCINVRTWSMGNAFTFSLLTTLLRVSPATSLMLTSNVSINMYNFSTAAITTFLWVLVTLFSWKWCCVAGLLGFRGGNEFILDS